jgi:signal transduction histidine kinase
MDLLRIVSLLTYTFGLYAFGALLVMWLRFPSEKCVTTGGPAADAGGRATNVVTFVMLVLCTLWFAGQLGRLLVSLDPEIEARWLNAVRLVLVFFFPPLIMQITYLDVQNHGRPLGHPAWRVGLWIVWIVSLFIPTYSLLAFYGPLPMPAVVGSNLGLAISLMFAVAAIYSSIAVSAGGRRRDETSEQRSGRRWMVVLYLALLVFVVLIAVSHFTGIPHGGLFAFIAGAMPLAFIFTSLYHESRFQFFDLFIKRGLFLLLCVVLLTAFFALVFPRVESLELDWARPWVFAVLLLPLAMALPWIYRRLSLWLDNALLGRRLTAVEAIKQLLADLGRACTSEDLVRRAEQGLSTMFQAPVRIRLGLAQAPRADREWVLDVPLEHAGERTGVMLLGRRANHMPYYSEDISLLRSLADVFAFMLDNIRLQQQRQEQERQARELTLEASRSELKALRAQINPHFLFNALNAIAGLIHKDPLRADQTVEQLAEIFRYTLRGSESEWAVLEDELDFVRAYLEVERARYGERLQVSVSTAPEVRAVRIPTMLVQTLVENAVKHGVARVRGPARIEVAARVENERLEIRVADSGPGFADESDAHPAPSARRSKGAGYGLKNVRERLSGHFGGRAELLTRRDEQHGMTVVSLILPLEHDRRSPLPDDSDGAPESHGVA